MKNVIPVILALTATMVSTAVVAQTPCPRTDGTESTHGARADQCASWLRWQLMRHRKSPDPTGRFTPVPRVNRPIMQDFPAPGAKSDSPATRHETPSVQDKWKQFFKSITQLAALTGPFGDKIIDGNLNDWTVDDRINLPFDRPPFLADGEALYGKYATVPAPVYLIALHSLHGPIGPGTTFWLNIDRNTATGYKIWGTYGGAEYFVNVYSDSTVHLYDARFNWIAALDSAYSGDRHSIEIAIPAIVMPALQPAQSINLLGDINDTAFLFPQHYAQGGQFTILGTKPVLPVRTNPNKRVAIFFGQSSRNRFFSAMAYSQLFMSMQAQAMQAGIPFDVIDEQDLTQIEKLVNYDLLIFPYFAHVPDNIRPAVHETLYNAVYKYHIGIITAEHWISNDANGGSVPGDSYRYRNNCSALCESMVPARLAFVSPPPTFRTRRCRAMPPVNRLLPTTRNGGITGTTPYRDKQSTLWPINRL